MGSDGHQEDTGQVSGYTAGSQAVLGGPATGVGTPQTLGEGSQYDARLTHWGITLCPRVWLWTCVGQRGTGVPSSRLS